MEFRDLKKQYQQLKPQMDAAIQQVLHDANFISGKQVAQLEEKLAEYVGSNTASPAATGPMRSAL